MEKVLKKYGKGIEKVWKMILKCVGTLISRNFGHKKSFKIGGY